MMVAASEANMIPLEPTEVVERGRLSPDQLLLVNVKKGAIYRDQKAKKHVATRNDYRLLANHILIPVKHRHLDAEIPQHLARLQRMHGWGAEDVRMVIQSMTETAL